MNIPCLDLKRQYAIIKDDVLKATEEVFEANAFSGGPYVEAFEGHFADYCQSNHTIACNNGTTALHLALLALKIGPDDEVIVPANTFIATAWAVSYVGAKIVFVDCEADTWEIDPRAVEKAITPKTKLIMGVHLYGQPFDIEGIQAIAQKHGIHFIEDAAQAQGAKYRGQRIGSFGALATFSFYPGKNLGAYGEAGAVTTSNAEYAKHLQMLRNHGMEKRYYHEIIGYNYRMDGLQGAILDIKLRHLDQWNSARRAIAKRYLTEVKNPLITMQATPEHIESVYHLFVITTPDRDGLMKYLNEKGVYPGLHYPVPCHLQKAYESLNYQVGDFPNTEYLASHCLSLPMFAELTDQEVSHVIAALNAYQA